MPVVLLHCYPFHRQASWLAAEYPHVYVDVGLTMTHLGVRAAAALGEFLELAPLRKLMFSTDAYGLPELYPVAAAQFRTALRTLINWHSIHWTPSSTSTLFGWPSGINRYHSKIR